MMKAEILPQKMLDQGSIQAVDGKIITESRVLDDLKNVLKLAL